MAEFKEPRTLGSTPGNTGTATHSTETNSTNTGIVGKVREQATAQLSSQKDKATDGLGSVAQAVRQTTQHLRENQHETVAHYAEQAADQIERFSQGLRNKDVGELMNDAQRLARRQPALFVGGAFALGLLGARFLKSSSPENRHPYGYGAGCYGGSDYGGANYSGAGYGNRDYGSAGGYSGTGYGNTGYGSTGYGASTGSTSGTGLSGAGVGSGSTDFGTTGSASGTTESMRGSSSTTGGTGTTSGRGAGSSRKSSVTSKRTDYPPTEDL
jgi:hypothetical protein